MKNALVSSIKLNFWIICYRVNKRHERTEMSFSTVYITNKLNYQTGKSATKKENVSKITRTNETIPEQKWLLGLTLKTLLVSIALYEGSLLREIALICAFESRINIYGAYETVDSLDACKCNTIMMKVQDAMLKQMWSYRHNLKHKMCVSDNINIKIQEHVQWGQENLHIQSTIKHRAFDTLVFIGLQVHYCLPHQNLSEEERYKNVWIAKAVTTKARRRWNACSNMDYKHVIPLFNLGRATGLHAFYIPVLRTASIVLYSTSWFINDIKVCTIYFDNNLIVPYARSYHWDGSKFLNGCSDHSNSFSYLKNPTNSTIRGLFIRVLARDNGSHLRIDV